MSKRVVRSWTFRSESNPNKAYETILYDDASLSCNCPGWTRRCQGGLRTCKHVRMAETGMAERYAEAVWGQQEVVEQKEPLMNKVMTKAEPVKKSKRLDLEIAVPTRRINWRRS